MEEENDNDPVLQQLIWLVLRLGLGAMWCVSAGTKLLDLDAFVRDVRNYKFPFVDVAPGDMLLGYGLPWLELFVGVALILGVWVKAAYLLSAGMFCMFMLGIGYAKYHGLAIHCGCFGSGGAPISYWHFFGLGLGLALVTALYLKEEGWHLGAGEWVRD